jgi:guanylate kinase
VCVCGCLKEIVVQVIAKRVEHAAKEIAAAEEDFWDLVVINDNLEVCFAALCDFIEANTILLAKSNEIPRNT